MRLCILYCLLILVGFGSAPGQGTKKTGPCASAQSQADMNDCWGREYKTADATLNQVYRQLVSKLDDEEKAQLKQVESAWLKYRDANCDFVADQYKGGTIRPMIDAMCLADMTQNRTAELRFQIKDRDH
jgi:uncharacterized protein YecT (DUF1311 family)